MTQISTKPPSGMRDFLAPEVARRRHVIGVIQRVYESFGFVPLETPTIENLTTLLGKYGPEGDQLLYRVLHRRERLARALERKPDGSGPGELDLSDEGLRYDLTVPLARVVANYGELPAFYKRYQIQPVWRADRPAKGRFREFWQCDVDVCGTKSLVAEAEVCGAVATVLRELGFGDFRIHLNHRELLRAMVAEAGIPAELEGTALIALDKLDKVGVDGVKAELTAKGVAADAGERLLARLPQLKNAVSQLSDSQLRLWVDQIAAHDEAPGELVRGFFAFGGSGGCNPSDRAMSALADLITLLALARCGPAGPHLEFDPTLARGLSYYTGPIFEITLPGLAGSIGGGGRYDGLIGMFTKRQIPAVGFSLGLERVLLVMEERGMFPALAVGPELLLCRFPDVPAAAAIAIATQLRTGTVRADGSPEPGLRVELYADTAPIGKQLQYANAIGVPWVGIVGGDELASQPPRVTLKHLATGKQESLPLASAPAHLRAVPSRGKNGG